MAHAHYSSVTERSRGVSGLSAIVVARGWRRRETFTGCGEHPPLWRGREQRCPYVNARRVSSAVHGDPPLFCYCGLPLAGVYTAGEGDGD